MKRKLLILFITALSSVVISGIVILVSYACADGDYGDYEFSFFAPEVIHSDEYSPFFRSFHTLYGSIWVENTIADFDSVNISEWNAFFGNQVKAKDLSFVIYQSRLGEVDTMIFWLKNASYSIKPYLKKNSIFTYTDKTVLKEFLFYLGFAKRCEPYATFVRDYWDDDATSKDPRKNTNEINKLVEGGKKLLSNVKTDFIRQRYNFQLVRLLYNSGDYDGCIDFYNQNKENFGNSNTIPYRAMVYAAGAYYKNQNYSRANYLYSLSYDKCHEMKVSSYLSFHPQEESDWQESLNMAATTREKTVLWQLLGIYADPLRAMKEIYRLDPSSDLMDLLLVRAINIEEEQFVPHSYDWSEKGSSFKIPASSVNNDLMQFVKNVADKKNTAKPYLWNLSAGYLYTAALDFKKAASYLSKALAGSKNDTLVLDQVKLIRFIAKVEGLQKPTPAFESEMAKEFVWLDTRRNDNVLRASYVYNWGMNRLAEKYAENGDSIRAICLAKKVTPDFYSDDIKANAMLAFMRKPSKSEFDTYILLNYPIKAEDVIEYQAINLVYKGQLKQALELFKASPGAGDGSLAADPLLIHINDCHDCDFLQRPDQPYTKQTLVEKMISLENQAATNTQNKAMLYFQMANAFYNISYFGNARDFYETSIYSRGLMDFLGVGENSDPVLSCAKAESYYQKAIEASTNNEFKAKCFFMAAKCEQNLFYLNWPANFSGDFKPGIYFKQLKDNYSRTKYYQEIIKECGYFKTYVSKR